MTRLAWTLGVPLLLLTDVRMAHAQSAGGVEVRDAIVAIRGTGIAEHRDATRGTVVLSESGWSGIVIDASGRVLTTAHSLAPQTREVWVQGATPMFTGRRYQVIAIDPELDLALLAPGTPFTTSQRFVDLANAPKVRVAQRVFAWVAVAPSFDSGAVSVTAGSVRSRDTLVAVTPESGVRKRAVVAVMPIWQGFSGGLLSDSLGRPLGLIRSRVTRDRDGTLLVAVPIPEIAIWLKSLESKEPHEKPLLARILRPLTLAPAGYLESSTSAGTTKKKPPRWGEIAATVFILYIITHPPRPAVAPSATASGPMPPDGRDGRLPPLNEPPIGTEEDRVHRMNEHEAAGLSHYVHAESDHSRSEIDLAIVEYETARIYRTPTSPMWCAVTYRIGLLYKWRGQRDLGRGYVQELRGSRLPQCQSLALDLQRALSAP